MLPYIPLGNTEEEDPEIWAYAQDIANAFRAGLADVSKAKPVLPSVAVLGCLILAACLTKDAGFVGKESYLAMAEQIWETSEMRKVN